MVSFRQLWNVMEDHKVNSPLMGSGDDDRALGVIKSGQDLRKDDEVSFWDDFISLCSNSGLAELLDVSPDKVANWPAKIQEYLDKLENSSREEEGKEEEKEMLPTGDTGAFTVNSDPDLGEL